MAKQSKGLIARATKLWNGFASFGRQQEQEYRASVNALNLFFGAIVGVNFANMVELPAEDYAILLFVTALMISFILVISSTSRKVWSAVQLAAALTGYYLLFVGDPIIEGVDRKLVITLAVWAGSTLLFEFTPRDPDPEPDSATKG